MRKIAAALMLLAMPLLGGCAYSGGAYAGYDPYFDSGYQGYDRPVTYYGQAEYGRPYGSAYEGYSDYYYGQGAYAYPQSSYYSYSYVAPPTYSYVAPQVVYSGASHHRARAVHRRCGC
jgi:hypothetical protein